MVFKPQFLNNEVPGPSGIGSLLKTEYDGLTTYWEDFGYEVFKIDMGGCAKCGSDFGFPP